MSLELLLSLILVSAKYLSSALSNFMPTLSLSGNPLWNSFLYRKYRLGLEGAFGGQNLLLCKQDSRGSTLEPLWGDRTHSESPVTSTCTLWNVHIPPQYHKLSHKYIFLEKKI